MYAHALISHTQCTLYYTEKPEQTWKNNTGNPTFYIYSFLYLFFVALIFILPCKYSPTITVIPSTRTRCSTQINMFATGISLFEQSVFPYEYICCTEVLYCHVFEILRPWGHLISTVTYSKITFISNRAYLQLFWLKLLRGVIKGNELFYLEN